jgi:Fic family protein
VSGATDHYPLLCLPDEKAAKEAANGVEQIEYVSDLIRIGITEVRESHVLDLHRLAVQDIYPCAGRYRTVPVTVGPYLPPHHSLVKSHTVDALTWLTENKQRPVLERAAYALWRFNWIHPFAGGNGRTSRAVAYLIICLEDRAMMPGKPNMPTRIYKRRDEYVKALRAADASPDADNPDFSAMVALLKDILMEQMAETIHRFASK